MNGRKRKKQMPLEQIVDIVREFFYTQTTIRLVYLFGSALKSRLTEESDIDIAVLFETTPNLFKVHEIAGDLEAKLKRDVDLIPLNAASPILRMQVLKNGMLVIGKDSKQYKQFFGDTISQYEDLKRIRRAGEKNLFEGATHGDRDILLSKADAIQRALKRIKDVTRDQGHSSRPTIAPLFRLHKKRILPARMERIPIIRKGGIVSIA